VIVGDASLWISYLLPDDVKHEVSREWFAQLSPDEEIVEPSLLLVEIAAGLSRRTGRFDLVQQAVATVRSDPRLRLHSMTDALMDEALTLAMRLRLRAGDAIYVALSRLTGATLVTWDREQRERAVAVVETRSPDDDLRGAL
jgi:predicted nucleic acid-binding protein